LAELDLSDIFDESDLKEEFVRSSGPGGQNVNKVSTAVQLRIHIDSLMLPEFAKLNLIRIAKNLINSDNELIIVATETRSQKRNREIARRKLRVLLRQCFFRPKKRLKTKPTKAARARRLQDKKRRSEIKKNRKSVGDFNLKNLS